MRREECAWPYRCTGSIRAPNLQPSASSGPSVCFPPGPGAERMHSVTTARQWLATHCQRSAKTRRIRPETEAAPTWEYHRPPASRDAKRPIGRPARLREGALRRDADDLREAMELAA